MQRTLWDELRKAMERFQLNDIELQRNADAVAAMQRMTQMLQSASPYKISSEVRGLIDQVDEFLTRLRTELTHTLACGERIQIKS